MREDLESGYAVQRSKYLGNLEFPKVLSPFIHCPMPFSECRGHAERDCVVERNPRWRLRGPHTLSSSAVAGHSAAV